MTTTKRPYSTAGKPRAAVQVEANQRPRITQEEWDIVMDRAIVEYGCNCNSCCWALLTEESLADLRAKRNNTASKPRTPAEALPDIEALSALLPDNTSDCKSLALDYQAELGRMAALKAAYDMALQHIKELETANHDLRNLICAPQMKADILQSTLADLLTAINAIPYHWIVADYLKRIEPQVARAGEVLAACGDGEAK